MDLGTYNQKTFTTDKAGKREKREYYLAEILKECQVDNPKTTEAWIYWKRLVPAGKTSADNIEKVYQEAMSKVKNDRINFAFAFNIVTKI